MSRGTAVEVYTISDSVTPDCVAIVTFCAQLDIIQQYGADHVSNTNHIWIRR